MEGDGLNCNNTFGKQAGSAVLRREQVDKDEMVESLYEKHHSIDIKPEYTDRQQFTNIKTEYDEKQHPININIGYFEKQHQLTNASMLNRDNSSTPQPISNINTGQMQVSDMKTEDSVKSHKQQRVLSNYTELPYKHQQVINNNTRHSDKQQRIPSIYIECGPYLPHRRDGYSVSCSIKKESKSAETTDACMSYPSGTYIGQEKTPPTMEQDTNKDVHDVMKFPQNLNSLDLSHVNYGNQFVFKKENSNFWQNNELRQNKDTGFKLYFHDSEASQNSKSVQPGKVTDEHNKTVLRCSKEIIYTDQNETFQNTKKLKRNDAKLDWLKNEEREATILTGTLMKHKRCLCKGTSDIMGEDKILLPHVFSIREDNILVPPVPMSIGKKNIGDKISNFSSKTDKSGGLQTIILSDNSDNVDGMCSVSTTGRPVSQNTNIEKDKRMTIMFEKIDQHVDHSSNIGYSLNKDGHEEDTVNKREDHARRCKQKRQQECIAGLSDFDSSYKKKTDKSCSSSGQKKCNKDTRKKCLNDKTPNSNAMVHNVKITNNDISNKCGNKGLSLHDLECNVCSKRFVNMFNLKRHVKTAKHISNKYGNKGLSLHGLECNVCSNRFANMYNLKRHYISVHARRNQESSDDENTKNTNAQLSKLKALERDEDLKSSPANNEHDERNETEIKTPSNIDSMHVPVDGVCGEDKNVYSDDHNDITNIPTDDNEFSSVILKCARCQFYLGTQAMKAELLLRYPNIDGYDNKEHHIQHVNKSRQSHSGKPPTKMSSYQMRIKLKRKYSNKKRGKKSLDALTCDICEQTFQTKEMLCNHIPTHFEKISFQCLICGEDHNDRQNLIEHIPIHIHHQNKVRLESYLQQRCSTKQNIHYRPCRFCFFHLPTCTVVRTCSTRAHSSYNLFLNNIYINRLLIVIASLLIQERKLHVHSYEWAEWTS